MNSQKIKSKKMRAKNKQKKGSSKYRTITMMFPPNHNDLIKVVCGGWDEETNKGQVFIEHNVPNSYVPKRYTDLETFTEKAAMLESVKSWVSKIEIEIRAQNLEQRDFESEETYYATAYNGLEVDTYYFPSVPINILEENDNVAVTIFGVIKIRVKKAAIFYIDVTNDPTMKVAGAVVSLGYYCWRISMKNATIINTNPFQIVCKAKDMERRFNRPTRRPV